MSHARKAKFTMFKKGVTSEENVIFFDIKGIVHKEFVLARRTVNSLYNILQRLRENVPRIRPEFWRKFITLFSY
jgi:hypothetical protein